MSGQTNSNKDVSSEIILTASRRESMDSEYGRLSPADLHGMTNVHKRSNITDHIQV
jgi:hypothetical protein